jgi:hypothetical protein
LNDQNHSPLNQAICDETDGRKVRRKDRGPEGWREGGRERRNRVFKSISTKTQAIGSHQLFKEKIANLWRSEIAIWRYGEIARLRYGEIAIWRYGELSPSPSPSPSHIIENKMLKFLRNYLDVSKKRILR